MVNDSKERVCKLVDIFVTYITGPSLDAGWHAPSQLESFQNAQKSKSAALKVKQLTVAFSQDDARGSNDRADDKMINELFYLRNQHHDYKLAVMLLSRLCDKYSLAILAEPYLKAVYKRTHTDAQIADLIEIPVHKYRHNRKMAIKNMGDALEIIDDYESTKSFVA